MKKKYEVIGRIGYPQGVLYKTAKITPVVLHLTFEIELSEEQGEPQEQLIERVARQHLTEAINSGIGFTVTRIVDRT